AQDHLCRSLYEQARGLRISGQAGRRWKALELLKEAEKLRSRPRTAGVPASTGPTQAELRSEAVALLLLQDARCVVEKDTPIAILPSLTADGRLAAIPLMRLLSKKGGAQLWDRDGVQLWDLLSWQETAKWRDKDMASAIPSPSGKLLAVTTRNRNQV